MLQKIKKKRALNKKKIKNTIYGLVILNLK